MAGLGLWKVLHLRDPMNGDADACALFEEMVIREEVHPLGCERACSMNRERSPHIPTLRCHHAQRALLCPVHTHMD